MFAKRRCVYSLAIVIVPLSGQVAQDRQTFSLHDSILLFGIYDNLRLVTSALVLEIKPLEAVFLLKMTLRVENGDFYAHNPDARSITELLDEKGNLNLATVRIILPGIPRGGYIATRVGTNAEGLRLCHRVIWHWTMSF